MSVTEAKSSVGVMCVQDMVYVKDVIVLMGLIVELPMILEMDDCGSIDLANSWSIGGDAFHVGCKLNWLHEMKKRRNHEILFGIN
jgi:hypothetical protein